MREQIDLIWSYLRGMWRFRWYMLGVAWLVAGAGWAASLQMPDQYQASAQVHVDTESMLRPLMRGLVVDSNTERRVEFMTQTLLSRPNLEQIARQALPGLNNGSSDDLNRVVGELRRQINLEGTGQNNMYRISYRGEDPEVTHNVVQAAIDVLIERSMVRSRDDTESATRFLDRRIEEYRARLDEAEQRRIEFRRENAAELSGGGAAGDYYQRLQQRMGDLEQARFELELARSREAELERQLGGETPVFGIMADGGARRAQTPELDQRIEAIEDEIDELLLRYTEEHPRVSSLVSQLERFEERRASERERLAAEGPRDDLFGGDPSLEQNPVHQEIRASLARARGEVAAARARVDQHQRQVRDLQERVDTVPEVEARFEQLTREFESIKAIYDDLVQRRQTAEISGEVDRSEDQVEFRIVESPRVPATPVAPNRPVLITASLGAAAAGYGALGLLLALMWPTFHTRASLRTALQLPVLGAIEQVYTHEARRRHWIELALYATAIAGLIAAYGVMLLLAGGYF